MAFNQPWPRNTVGRKPINYGDRHSSLTAVGRIGARAPYKINCQCDCGHRMTVAAIQFRRAPCSVCSPHAKARAKVNAKYAVGAQFGALTILEQTASDPKGRRFRVRCSCGAEYPTRQNTLTAVRGCRSCFPGGPKTKYGDTAVAGKTLLYRTWGSMRHRCRAVDDPRYRHHAGKGIRVCEDWHDFAKFRDWALANGYQPGLTIDRIDADKDYEPSNCQWITRSENSKRARADYMFVKKTSGGFASYLPIETLFGSA